MDLKMNTSNPILQVRLESAYESKLAIAHRLIHLKAECYVLMELPLECVIAGSLVRTLPIIVDAGRLEGGWSIRPATARSDCRIVLTVRSTCSQRRPEQVGKAYYDYKEGQKRFDASDTCSS